MSDISPVTPVLLSAIPASPQQNRRALVISLVLFVGVLATIPFAQIGAPHFPAFVLLQQTLLLANDMITAAVLFAQYWIGRIRTLNVLAAGYLFTSLIVIPHALTFPGAFSEAGLLGAGPQSAAWLYLGWHAVLPVATIVFALRPNDQVAVEPPGGVNAAISGAVLSAAALTGAITLLVTWGHDWLPSVIENGRFSLPTRVAVGTVLIMPLCAFLVLARRHPRSVLDLWLMVVMFAWLCTITIGAFISSGRFDVGWYVGRVFDWLASLVVLLMLFSQTIGLYARSVRAAVVERHERQRRIKEMEAVLIHLSRVSELGQNVSALIHEVNQPLAAITNYVAASIQLLATANTAGVKAILERTAEQANRATEIIRHLREFIRRGEGEKAVADVRTIIDNAVRLASVGAAGHPTIDIRCAPTASTAFCDRVQIEQVIFNLVRNAIEAMSGTARRSITISTTLAADDMVEIRVADTGPGLAPEIREKLFEPFITSKVSGLGIGLSVCRVIVEAHGGELRAEDNPGGGTTFLFTLPQAQSDQMIV